MDGRIRDIPALQFFYQCSGELLPKLSVVGDEPRQLTTGNYVRTVVTVNLVPFTSDRNHEGDSMLNRVSKGLLNEQKCFIKNS